MNRSAEYMEVLRFLDTEYSYSDSLGLESRKAQIENVYGFMEKMRADCNTLLAANKEKDDRIAELEFELDKMEDELSERCGDNLELRGKLAKIREVVM